MKRDGNGLWNLTGWVLLAVPILMLAVHLATRGPAAPDVAVSLAPAAGGKEGGKRMGPGNNEDKWPEVEAFMSAHSKHKLEAYRRLPPAEQAKLRAQFIARYNELSSLSSNKPLHDIEVQRIQIEDDLFAALLERRRPHVAGEAYSTAYLTAVENFVKNRMEEHRVRLANLQAQVQNLQALVNKDAGIEDNPARLKEFVLKRAHAIETNGIGAGQGGRRRIMGHPTTAESED